MLNPRFIKAATISLSLLIPTLSSAEESIVLPDPAFAPEGITASKDGTLYLGSLVQGRLISVSSKTGKANDFAKAGENGMVTVVGVHVSADDKLLYVCSSDPGIGKLTGSAPTALLAFDRKTGNPAGRFNLPEGGGFCNDIAELPDGTILATDSFSPRIYALKKGSDKLATWMEDGRFTAEGFNLNGIAYDDGAVYVLRYNKGSMHKIAINSDGSAGEISDINLPEPIKGADGLNALGKGRFLAVAGGGLHAGAKGSLVGIKIAKNKVKMKTIADDLNVPTTAVVVDDYAYVVEGQLDHLFDPKAGPADPYRIIKVKLPSKFR